MEDRVRVLHVIDGLGWGGSEEWVREIVRLANPERFQFRVCHLGAGSQREEEIRQLGAEIVRLRETTIHSVIPEPALIAGLLRNVRSFRPHVLHIHLHAAYFYGAVVGRLSRVRGIVYTVPALKDQVQWWIFPIMYRLFRWGVDAFVTAISAEELMIHSGIPANKIVMKKGVIDTSTMVHVAREDNPVVPEFNLADAFPVLLSVGRLHPSKGHNYAIDAVAHLVPHFPKTRLLILGHGDELPALRRLVTSLGLDQHVILAGFRNDLENFYSLAHIYLRMCTIEASNLASYRAMGYGKPVIGFDSGAATECLVNDHSGILVPLGDVQALAAAVCRVLEDHDLRERLAGNARELILNEYDIRRSIELYEGIYERMSRR